mmetsp:Transcript_72388/g.132145  ORF Transcript_72388/g.132145 Transcript_72388/m.132145 type:complete len:802 (-) Transcript_72388:153-2558(-)
MADTQASQPADAAEYEEQVRFFNNLLHSNRDEWEKRVNVCLGNGQHRILLELQKLDEAQPGLSRRVLESPVKYILPFEEALLSFVRDINEKAMRNLKQPLKLDIQGAFGRNHVTPRGVTSNTLQNLMRIEGVVTKAGIMAPKLLQSMHVRKNAEDHVEARDHRDATAFVNQPAAGAMPSHDLEGNELTMEIGLSVYKDYQKFNVQEAPDSAPPGQIPRSIEVICEGDLAEKCKPGDRVQVTGVYRSFPPTLTDYTTGVFPARLIATNITLIKELTNQPFLVDDIKHIREIAARPDAFQLLARSFAPSICGHEKVKAGMLLLMIGGVEKTLPNGTHLRGDINMLMVGDPSCGKSQMLRFVMNTAPLAISTTGRGSSGVGLTAALVREQGSRDFTVEAGAMVLADRGIICIDEFDKMGLVDRVMIHEAMEQQCVTIAKAGMHITLNSRASVLAAANPIDSSFDANKSLTENIGMPDSLLSRFDLIFIVRDNTNEEIDRRIADQVVRQASQRYGSEFRRGVEEVHSNIIQRRLQEDTRRSTEATEVFERGVPGPNGEEPPEVLSIDFLRKYMRFCKRLEPVLSEEAQQEISDRYVDMRLRFQTGIVDRSDPNAPQKKPRLAVTTRTLEALIRLSTAVAKLKLRKDYVLPEDVQEAHKLMLSAREEEVPAVPVAGDAPDDGDDGSAPGAGGAAAAAGGAAAADAAGEAEGSEGRRGKKRTRDEAEGEEVITPERVNVMTTLVARSFTRQKANAMTQAELLEGVNAGLVAGEQPFEVEEFEAGLRAMEAQNKVFLLNDTKEVMIVG